MLESENTAVTTRQNLSQNETVGLLNAGFWFWWFTRTLGEVSVSLHQNKSRVVQQNINLLPCTLIIRGWFWHLDFRAGLWMWTGGGLVSGQDRPRWAFTDWMLWYRWRESHQSWAQTSFHTVTPSEPSRTVLMHWRVSPTQNNMDRACHWKCLQILTNQIQWESKTSSRNSVRCHSSFITSTHFLYCCKYLYINKL